MKVIVLGSLEGINSKMGKTSEGLGQELHDLARAKSNAAFTPKLKHV